jgi:hypothetical protein
LRAIGRIPPKRLINSFMFVKPSGVFIVLLLRH